MNATVRIRVTTLVVLAFWWSGAGIAAAHTALDRSDPATEAHVTSPPAVVALAVTEDIDPAFATVVVTSADGATWVCGPARVDGPRLRAAVRAASPPTGGYTVGYRVVSTDGHPVPGSYAFTVAGAPGQPPPASTRTNDAPRIDFPKAAAAPPPSPAPVGSDSKTSILTAGVLGLALGGAIAFWQSRKHRRNNDAGHADEADEP